MPEERGLYPKMRVGEQLVYLARLHGMTAAAGRARHAGLDRAARRRRPPRRRRAAALAGQPAARPARRRARPRPGRSWSSTSRSPAWTRSRVDVMSDVLRERPRAGVPVDLLQPPARPRRAAVRPGRHRPRRRDGRRGDGRRAARGRPEPADRRRPAARPTAGPDALPGVTVRGREGRGRTELRARQRRRRPGGAARGAENGPVHEFAHRRPT